MEKDDALDMWERFEKEGNAGLREKDVGESVESPAEAKLRETFTRATKRHTGLGKVLGEMFSAVDRESEKDTPMTKQMMGLPDHDPLLVLSAHLGESLTDDHIDEVMGRVHRAASHYVEFMRHLQGFNPKTREEVATLGKPFSAVRDALALMKPDDILKREGIELGAGEGVQFLRRRKKSRKKSRKKTPSKKKTTQRLLPQDILKTIL